MICRRIQISNACVVQSNVLLACLSLYLINVFVFVCLV